MGRMNEAQSQLVAALQSASWLNGPAATLCLIVFSACSFAQSGLNDLEPCSSQRLHPFEEHGKLGFIDNTGKIVVPPRFRGMAGGFSEGLAVVYENGKAAFMDEGGTIIFRTEASRAEGFSDGLAAVEIRGLWGYVDHSGHMAIPPQFTHVMPFKEGIAATNRKFNVANWHAIDKSGHVLFEPHLTASTARSVGLAVGWRPILEENNSATSTPRANGLSLLSLIGPRNLKKVLLLFRSEANGAISTQKGDL